MSQITSRQLELRAIESLVAARDNPRTHSAAQVARLAASIAEFGFTNPVLVSPAGEILAGHGRVLAARELGMTHVPVLVLAHLTEAQRRAYLIADNQLALAAGWDDGLLTNILDDLKAESFDLSLTGFDDAELARLMEPPEVGGADDQSDLLAGRFDVLVRCSDESQQTELLARLSGEGYECRALFG